MMILQIINSLNIGGAEKFVVETALQFKKNGCKVEVLVFDRRESPFVKILTDSGIKVRYTLSKKYLSPLNLLTFIWVVWSSKYKVIHTHLTYSQLWCAIASILNFRGKKIITTEHSNNNNRRSSSILNLVDKFIYSRYATVVCVSESVRESLIGWVKPKSVSKYVVVPNCVDIDKFRKTINQLSRYEFNIDSSDIVVLMVGRMSSAKDQITLIRSVEMLPDSYKCVLVGDGDTFQEVQDSVINKTQIIFTKARTDIPQLMAMCDIYVQSSHWEGLPTTVLEAMAAKKIVLGSKVKGNIDVIPTAQLFEHQNSCQLSELIARYAYTDNATELGEQELIIQKYSLHKVASQLESIYEL